MKILHLTTTFSFAGAERIILDLCDGPWNCEVAALTPGDGVFKEKLKTLNIPTHQLDMSSKFDLSVMSRIRDIVKRGAFDAVHTHLVHANTVGRWALRSTNIPVVSTMHIVESRFRPWHDWAERLTAPYAQFITGVSPDVCDRLTRLRIEPDKIKLVANGINTQHYTTPSSTHRDIDLLFIGRLDQQKGLDRLLPILEKISEQRAMKMVIVGSGPDEVQLKHNAKNRRLPIEWTGQIADTAPWYQRAKVCLMPSRWEGFGLTAAEALACGCDLWHSDIDPLNWVAGEWGHHLDWRSPDLVPKLIEAVDTFEENTERSAWVRAQWDVTRMRSDYNSLYESL